VLSADCAPATQLVLPGLLLGLLAFQPGNLNGGWAETVELSA
jgi:hypothetical protein